MLKAYTYLQLRLATRDRDRGATAVEYGLMVAGIAVVVIAIVFGLGGTLKNLFSSANNALKNNGTP